MQLISGYLLHEHEYRIVPLHRYSVFERVRTGRHSIKKHCSLQCVKEQYQCDKLAYTPPLFSLFFLTSSIRNRIPNFWLRCATLYRREETIRITSEKIVSKRECYSTTMIFSTRFDLAIGREWCLWKRTTPRLSSFIII